MASKGLRTKLTPLTKNESPQSFEHFRETMLLNLLEDTRFKEYVHLTWKLESEERHCGFQSDSTKTAEQRKLELKLMLGTVASFIPVVSRTFIVNQCTSLHQIWARLRVYYGFRKNGSRVLGLLEYSLGHSQSYEDLWEEMYSHLEECLLDPDDNLTHMNAPVSRKEKLTPTVLNILVAQWLNAINPLLLQKVRERFSKELSSSTLFTIREQISESLPSLLEPHTASVAMAKTSSQPSRRINTASKPKIPSKCCCLCKTAGRPDGHFLSQCSFLPQPDRRFMARARLIHIEDEQEENDSDDQVHPDHAASPHPPSVQRATVEASPTLSATHKSANVSIVLDSGAHANIMDIRELQRLKLPLKSTHIRTAIQADGSSPMNVLGEFSCDLQRGHHSLIFEGIFVNNLGCPLIGGMPFHSQNNIAVDMTKRVITLDNCCAMSYDSSRSPRTPVAMIIRVPSNTCLLPGESIAFDLPPCFSGEEIIGIEPRLQHPTKDDCSWLAPCIQLVENERFSITNSSNSPILLTKHQHAFNIRRTEHMTSELTAPSPQPGKIDPGQRKPPLSGHFYSDDCTLDPDQVLDKETRQKFITIHREHDNVFSPDIGLYNGSSGPFQFHINMGPALPPQRKGRLPLYSSADKVALQDKFDELYGQGVFVRPEEANIHVEYVNPSFLIRKSNGGWRLVTAFAEVAQYCKPQPSLLPSAEETIRAIGQWRYLIKSDLAQAYYQIPVSKESMKYLGVCTPFKGIYVYQRCAMGMPGSETALEELLCRILGDLLAKGTVCKLADDLYCGGDSPVQVAKTWRKVLSKLHANGLHISTTKTVIFPTKTMVLGWIWNNGQLSASPHRVSALEKCEPPPTVKGLRSFIGAMKFLSKVIPHHVDHLDPLQTTVAGRQSSEKIQWTDELLSAFHRCQACLSNTKSITIPKSDDELQIVTDAAGSKKGLAATLFVLRDGKPLIAGFFNAKMKSHQLNWLPCEVEALCIGAAVKHFAPYITQSSHKCTVFTDSRPCVQAYNRLIQGKFSNSARVLTFISVLSNYGVIVKHIPGDSNLLADYSSRSPIECLDSTCQICAYVAETEESVVRAVNVSDITADHTLDMYTSRAAWHEIQRGCDDLKRVHAHLSQGTRPSRKLKHLRHVRRYLNDVTIARDGLLVHRDHSNRFRPGRERIVVPQNVLHGIVTAFHLKLSHPSRAQLLKAMKRSFYAINLSDAIDLVHRNCHVCASLADIPTVFTPQSTSPPPDTVGSVFSADCIRRCRQTIFVLREKVTAYTVTKLIDDERSNTLRNCFLETTAAVRSSAGPQIDIRVDPASAFRSLANDRVLRSHGIHLTIGDAKNVNKNPIAERAIRELHCEFRKLQPGGGPIDSTTLALATSRVNALIRESQLSSLEMWTRRDQFTNHQLPMSDRQLIADRQQQRLDSHLPSAKFRSRGRLTPRVPSVDLGDLVYLISDGNKLTARDKYLVTKYDPPHCHVQKFIGQQLRARPYRVKLSDCQVIQPTPVPRAPTDDSYSSSNPESDTDEHDDAPVLPLNHNQEGDTDPEHSPPNCRSDEDDHPPDRNKPDHLKTTRDLSDRPRRTARRPVRFQDYYVTESDGEEENE